MLFDRSLLRYNICTNWKMNKSVLEIGIAEIDYTPEVGLNLVGNYCMMNIIVLGHYKHMFFYYYFCNHISI